MCPVRCYIAEGHHQWVSTVLETVPLILPENEPRITKCSGQDRPHPIVKFRPGTSPFTNTVGKLQRVSEIQTCCGDQPSHEWTRGSRWHKQTPFLVSELSEVLADTGTTGQEKITQ